MMHAYWSLFLLASGGDPAGFTVLAGWQIMKQYMPKVAVSSEGQVAAPALAKGKSLHQGIAQSDEALRKLPIPAVRIVKRLFGSKTSKSRAFDDPSSCTQCLGRKKKTSCCGFGGKYTCCNDAFPRHKSFIDVCTILGMGWDIDTTVKIPRQDFFGAERVDFHGLHWVGINHFICDADDLLSPWVLGPEHKDSKTYGENERRVFETKTTAAASQKRREEDEESPEEAARGLANPPSKAPVQRHLIKSQRKREWLDRMNKRVDRVEDALDRNERTKKGDEDDEEEEEQEGTPVREVKSTLTLPGFTFEQAQAIEPALLVGLAGILPFNEKTMGLEGTGKAPVVNILGYSISVDDNIAKVHFKVDPGAYTVDDVVKSLTQGAELLTMFLAALVEQNVDGCADALHDALNPDGTEKQIKDIQVGVLEPKASNSGALVELTAKPHRLGVGYEEEEGRREVESMLEAEEEEGRRHAEGTDD